MDYLQELPDIDILSDLPEHSASSNHLAQGRRQHSTFTCCLYMFTKLTEQSQRTSCVMYGFCYPALGFIHVLANSHNWVLLAVFHCVDLPIPLVMCIVYFPVLGISINWSPLHSSDHV